MLAVTFILLLVLLVEQQVAAASKPVRCSAWGDPHVTRFSMNETDFPKEEWCQYTGLLWLVKNEYVHSTILVGPSPYFILGFNFAWYDDNGMVICTMNGIDVTARALPNCGPDITISMVDKTVTVTYKKVDFVAIISIDHTSPSTFSISIWQDPCLAKLSDGICKTGCGANYGACITTTTSTTSTTTRVAPQTTPSPNACNNQNQVKAAAQEICAVYMQKATAVLNLKVNDTNSIYATELKNAETACITDVKVTGDLHVVNSSVLFLALHALTANVSSSDNLHNVIATDLNKTLNLWTKINNDAANEVCKNIIGSNTSVLTSSTAKPPISPDSPKCVPECKNNGTCIGQNNCSCKSGFTGPTCEVQSIGLCQEKDTFDKDPIVLITFGSGSAQYSQDTPAHFNFSTTYKQQFGPVTSDGTFSFINSIRDDFAGSWHTNATDHTGDKGGYMFLVNANYNPDQFYNGTVKNLCVGLRYELSAYLANVDKPDNRVQPKVRFEVRSATSDHQLLAQLQTGEIPMEKTLTWKKYGLSFIPTTSTVVLLMIDEATGGNGNDIAIDDIALRVCAHEGSGLCPPK